MLLLKKLGATCCIIGILGILGPFIGIALRGLKAGESQIAGLGLAGVRAVLWVIGILVEKAQDALQTRRQIEMRKHAREPDDVIK